MLDFWCSILFSEYESAIKKYKCDNEERIITNNNLNSNSEITDVMVIKEVQKDSYMYSSKITLKYVGDYMQEIFHNNEKPNIILQMFLVGKIICNMKYDFTGEKTAVMDLLRMKLNDLTIKKKVKIYLYEIKYLLKIKYIRF